MQLTRKRLSSGSTLVEVMIALLILAILAVGAAASIYYGRSSVYAQRDRLSVLELVNGRLELLRILPYADLTPPNEDGATYFITCAAGACTVSSSETQEQIPVNSRLYSMTTAVRYVDVDQGTPSYDALQLTVSMQYRTGSSDTITLSTYRSP